MTTPPAPLALSLAWPLLKITSPLSEAVPLTTQKTRNLRSKAAASDCVPGDGRWEVPRVLEAGGTSSQENLSVGPQTPTLHSNSSYLRTETTSRDELERVQLIRTLGAGVGDSPKPQTPHPSHTSFGSGLGGDACGCRHTQLKGRDARRRERRRRPSSPRASSSPVFASDCWLLSLPAVPRPAPPRPPPWGR